jgi:streptogramin lyase
VRPFCVFAAVGVLTVAGCGGDDSGSEETSTTTSAEEETALPEPIPAAGAANVDIDQRLEREITIDSGPDRLVEAFGSLWVKRDDGKVIRVDPDAGKVLAEIETVPFKQPVCQGLGVSDDSIWECPRKGTVVRVDPESDTVDAEVQIDKVLDQTNLVTVDDSLWVLTKEGSELTPIDAHTNKPGNPIDLGGTCTDLAASEHEIWVTCYVDSRVLRVDPAAGKVAAEIDLDRPRAIALGKDLWVGFELGLAQLDPESLEVVAIYDVFPGGGGAIFAGPDEVWVREDGGHFLVRIDPVAHEVVETIDAPKLKSGGDVIVIDDSVWATAFNDEALVELQAP